MNADAMATRMSVLTRALPSRILLVDDDELEVELMADRLSGAGFEIARAANGKEALAMLANVWYPVVITDWQMPVMDGIAFTEALRASGKDDTYVIMVTMREASVDYERGYISGVDDYLTKRVPDAELFARISAAFNTLALRRSLRQMQSALEQSVVIDAESGAYAFSELCGKLLGETRRAQRYGRQLAVLTVGVRADGHAAAIPGADVLRGVVQVIDGAIRSHIDWIGRVEAKDGAAFAVVLPEAGVGEGPAIKERVIGALRRYAERSEPLKLQFDFGLVALASGSADSIPVEAKQMLDVAEHCRRCPGRAGTEQLSAVQRSVASHVAIACRHGYVVDTVCGLKAVAPVAETAESPELARFCPTPQVPCPKPISDLDSSSAVLNQQRFVSIPDRG